MAAPRWSLMIHGGAGGLEPPGPPGVEAAAHAGLEAALAAGAAVLGAGGAALDAVEAAVRVMEDDPVFNAGRGSSLTTEGVVEMDASIMAGESQAAGAVAGVSRVRHPITAARAVMERTPHVLLVGAGAEAFATAQGIEQAEPGWFVTESRWRDLEKALEKRGLPIPPRPAGMAVGEAARGGGEERFGTVGAVARDVAGHLAAATSTGGYSAKLPGRVGDSPIIGAGTFARDAVCAVSGTGTGEFFIRLSAAHEVAALVRHAGLGLADAADQVMRRDIVGLGGDGGLIAVGPDGAGACCFTTSAMSRGWIAEGVAPRTALWSADPFTFG